MTSNFDKFTERSRRVLYLSQQEANRRDHPFIGAEHLLLALVIEGEGVAARVLADLGVQPHRASAAVEFMMGRGEGAVKGEIGLTSQARRVIEQAVDESRRLDVSYIGTEHLLLGLLRETEGAVAGILELLGINPVRARQQVMQEVAQAKRSPEAENAVVETTTPAQTEAQRLENEIDRARAERNPNRVRDLEFQLARIRLRELDDHKEKLVTQLIAAEGRRIEIDDSIRELLVELDRVNQQRRSHFEKFVPRVLLGQRHKRAQQRNVEDDPEDKRETLK